MSTRFTQISSERPTDDVTERAVRNLRLVAEELQRRVRDLEDAPTPVLVGILHLSMSADQASVSTGNTIQLDTEDLNTTGDLARLVGYTLYLERGYRYRLLAGMHITGASGRLQPQWYDTDGAASVGTRGVVSVVTGTSAEGNQATAAYALAASGQTKLQLRAAFAASTPTIAHVASWATVEVYRP